MKEVGKIFHIKSLDDDRNGFREFSKILEVSFLTESKIVIDFSECKWLRANMLAIFASYMSTLKTNSTDVSMDYTSMNKIVSNAFTETNFEEIADNKIDYFDATSNQMASFGKFKKISIAGKYIRYKLLRTPKLKIGEKLLNKVVNNISECFLNIHEHSMSGDSYIYIASHYSQKRDELKITITDNGCGIPTNVRTVPSCELLTDGEAVSWAFQQTNSSKQNVGAPQGLGFFMLQSFIKANSGSLEIYSGQGYLKYDKFSQSYDLLDFKIAGTIINITINCDDNFYFLREQNG